MTIITIKLLAEWSVGSDTFDAGTVLRVDESTADELIAAKTAERYDPEAEAKAAEAEAEMVKRIVSTVKSEIGETEEKSAPPITVHDRSEDDPTGGWKSLSEFGAAVMNASIGKGLDDRLAKASGMSEGISSDGGFLVPEEFASEVLRKASDGAVVYPRARQLSMSSNTLKIPYIAEASRVDGARSGGVRGYWLAEAAQKPPSAPAFGQVELNLSKLVVLMYATDELIQDTTALGGLLGELAADEISFKLDDAVINGTGAGQPLGVLNAPALVTVAKEVGQDKNTVVAENIMKMWAALHSRSRGNAVWFINQSIMPQLHSMGIAVGTGGLPVYMPANGLAGSANSTLYGAPVIDIEQCPALGTAGDIILADMSQYVFAQHSAGTEYQTSIHLKFNYDETAFRWVVRVDGQPWWATALTPYKGATPVSPFVTLATRA